MPPDPPKTPERRVDLNKFDEQDKTWLQKAKVYPSEEVAKPSLSATLILDDKVWPSLPKIENDDQTSLMKETSLEGLQPSSEYRVTTKALRASGDVINYESPYPTTEVNVKREYKLREVFEYARTASKKRKVHTICLKDEPPKTPEQPIKKRGCPNAPVRPMFPMLASQYKPNPKRMTLNTKSSIKKCKGRRKRNEFIDNLVHLKKLARLSRIKKRNELRKRNVLRKRLDHFKKRLDHFKKFARRSLLRMNVRKLEPKGSP